ncbi:hypothetical protein GF318_02275 [Candidatus Micrarchaeota archaeon]|nr:hypothetical protein [Candidatus Micrarchaeota archaeon]
MQELEEIVARAEHTQEYEFYSSSIDRLFLLAAGAVDREKALSFLVSRTGSWCGMVAQKLRESRKTGPEEKLMFSYITRTIQPKDMAALLDAENPEIAKWAADFVLSLNTEQKMEVYAAYFPSLGPAFRSQTDVKGNPLEAWRTRYLDGMVLEVCGSTVVQDTALRLGVLPRDLEVMTFYVYSDFRPEAAVNTHETGPGTDLIPTVTTHLTGHEAAKILEASYYIYLLRDTSLPAERARPFAELLWEIADSMEEFAPYSVSFVNKAAALRQEICGEKA